MSYVVKKRGRGRPRIWKNETERTAAFRKNNREKSRAHSALWNAVAKGKIKRQDTCQVCGAMKGECTPRGTRVIIDAHHHDYSKPLEVEWLCRACHNAESMAYRELVEDLANSHEAATRA